MQILILLYQQTYKTTFEKYITTGMLLDAVLFFACITFSLVVFTYLYLSLKKKAFFLKGRIRKSLELWISHVILAEEGEELVIPEKFRKMFRDPVARQYAIEHLIINKKAFSGMVAQNIRQLYEKLGFKQDSLEKLASRTWYTRAKGIQELSLMDQDDQLIRVYRLTNSRNELVRNEAQNAIIQWSGFKGLRFLDVVSYDISEWQQVQLLVLLKNFPAQDLPRLPHWLMSSNATVVVFALKLADVYQQFGVKQEVEACLGNPGEAIRRQAVNTLARIGDGESADKMILQYQQETTANQLNMLAQLPAIAEEKHLGFLLQQLDHDNDFIKLSAAKAIAALRRIDLVARKAQVQPEPFDQIYRHVKAEMH